MKKKKAKLRRIYEEQGILYKEKEETKVSLIEEKGKHKISITNEDGIPLEQIMKLIELTEK